MPPEWMWPLSDDLDEWFQDLDRKRKAKYGGEDYVEEPDDMAQNDLARGRR
jgi:hypothetical protein